MINFDEGMLPGEWAVLVGRTYKEFLTHDFESRPHMIVAGATGFGKSEFLKLLISTLIKQKSEHARLHLIDLKGGNELGPFKDLKQCNSFARDPEIGRASCRERVCSTVGGAGFSEMER